MSVVNSSGSGDLLLIGEAPGHEEQIQGEGFVGKSGAELWAGMKRICGLTRDDFRITNVCREGLPNNRPPNAEEIGRWLPSLLDEIDQTNPRLIVAAGGVAAKVLLDSHRPMTDLHGILHRTMLAGTERWVLPIYHPAAGLHSKGFFAAFYYDLQALQEHLAAPFPLPWFPCALQPTVAWSEGDLPVDDNIVAVDTEGWRHKPWGLSFTTDGLNAWVIRADDQTTLSWFADWIRTKTVCAHNILYDLPVLRKMRIDLRNARIHDTQVLAFHEMLQTGSGVLEQESQNLGTLAYRIFGMELADLADLPGVDFAAETIPYSDAVMTYAGMDVIADWHLFQHYRARGYADTQLYRIDMGQVRLVEEMIHEGLPFDTEGVADFLLEVKGKRDVVTEDLKAIAARRGLHDFNPGSHPQVRELLTKKYGLRIRKRTKGGKSSTNEKALAPHKDHLIVKKIQDYRELVKLEGTYLVPLMEQLA